MYDTITISKKCSGDFSEVMLDTVTYYDAIWCLMWNVFNKMAGQWFLESGYRLFIFAIGCQIILQFTAFKHNTSLTICGGV